MLRILYEFSLIYTNIGAFCVLKPLILWAFLLFRFHGGEQNYVSDGNGFCQQHNESVDTYAQTACRRHTIFQSCQEVFIDHVCFVVACFSQVFLIFETMTLVDGVIQFGVCVAVFSANDKQFETFCEFRFIGFSLCQRRDFYGVVNDECRLNQVLFYEFFEEQVQDIAFYMTFFIFYMMFVSDSLRFCCISYLVEVYASTMVFLAKGLPRSSS